MLQQTILNASHRALGARMVAFAEPSHFQKTNKQPQLSQTIQLDADNESQESPAKGRSNNPLYT